MDYMSVKTQNRTLNYDEILSRQVYLKSKPMFFSFAICGPCNLKCLHCGYRLFGRTSEQQVSEEVYSKVLTEIMPTAYRCHLGGSNWGEMTIGKHFHRFLQDAKRFGVGINLTTNGTRLVDDWFGDLLDTLHVIGFSMEGMNDEFEKMRGFRWRHFLKNVEKVCQGRVDYNKKFTVEWRYCAHAGSIHQLPDMIRLARSIGVNRIQVMNLVAYDKSQRYGSLFYHRSLANHWFSESRRVATELNFDINIPPDFAIADIRKTSPFDNPVAKGSGGRHNGNAESIAEAPSSDPSALVNCYRPWQTCVVNELGAVTPSDIYWRSMGNLERNSFAAIWNGWRYRRLRKQINTRPDSICRACRLPQFDSEENRAFSQLTPSLKQLIKNSGNLLLAKSERPQFSGIMDEEFDPNSKTSRTSTD